ncbi:Panacea domain-containing protein [Flavobacterium sp. HJ-32-4]|nr:type II toxin-antitoxin system antitoxin SocA domain-containing protein [Flavobacterium sp. HJ-32-4]UMY65437.1 DUF4065 domain-containing protein [Flavobacterium sp. HJ-32-4]
MPHSALYIAGEILKRGLEQGVGISNMKLQKLLYIANGLYLAQTGQLLLNDPTEAWPYGPVYKEVYHAFKQYGNANIVTLPLQYTLKPKVELDNTENSTIDFAIDIAKKLDAVQLSNWTHIDGSPWSEAFNNRYGVISKDSMERYFKQFLKKAE